ncbi:uncharacterized protein IWZ02DRAFT_113552 [Phyllosticta citriasiana]|uniref:uncharacterized protein n=1 Tax=Phyllosticta citriasiana TaxID=595635 RepID=UPI0030FD5A37
MRSRRAASKEIAVYPVIGHPSHTDSPDIVLYYSLTQPVSPTTLLAHSLPDTSTNRPRHTYAMNRASRIGSPAHWRPDIIERHIRRTNERNSSVLFSASLHCTATDASLVCMHDAHLGLPATTQHHDLNIPTSPHLNERRPVLHTFSARIYACVHACVYVCMYVCIYAQRDAAPCNQRLSIHPSIHTSTYVRLARHLNVCMHIASSQQPAASAASQSVYS